MKTIGRASILDGIRYDLRGPALVAADRLAAQGVRIVKLNTGNPGAFGFTAPESVLKAVSDNLCAALPYAQSKGLNSAREAIAAYYAKKGVSIHPDYIYTGNGVSELIHMSVQALLSPGDEILIPTPDYPLWTAATKLYGGTAVHYMCDEDNHWCPNIEDMRSKITDRTRAIVVINPNNPTGVLYPDETLTQIAELAREHDLLIFSDEIYESVVMDGKIHTPMAKIAPDLLVVAFGGLSKSHNLTGYRAGWMYLSGDLSGASEYITGLDLIASMRLCSNVPAQYAIPAALENFEEMNAVFAPGGRVYEQREIIMDALDNTPGLSAVRPDAAFYVFPKLDIGRFNITDDEQFVLDFLEAKHILLVNGRGFNWAEPDHFRIVYLPERDDLIFVADALRDFLSTYRAG